MTEREIEAYQAALRRLSAADKTAMPDEEFRRQLAAAEEEEQRETVPSPAAEHGQCRLPALTHGVPRPESRLTRISSSCRNAGRSVWLRSWRQQNES